MPPLPLIAQIGLNVAPNLIGAGLGIAPSLIGAGMSYAQAAIQYKNMKEAEAASAKAIAAARAKLQEAPLERLQVPTEAYQNALQNITAQSMQFTEAAREAGARELAASIGRLGAAGLRATEREREDMAQNIFKRDVAVAEDEAVRLSKLAQLDEKEARDAQIAAAQAQERMGYALASGTSSLGSAIDTGYDQWQLYKKQNAEGTNAEGTNAEGTNAEGTNGIGSTNFANAIPFEAFGVKSQPTLGSNEYYMQMLQQLLKGMSTPSYNQEK
jgi:hypothetical protein